VRRSLGTSRSSRPLIRSEDVSNRLNRQYTFYKSVFDYPRLVPVGIDTTHISRVIDVAAGTGAWALDFVSMPDVRDRKDRDLQVFACDISTEKFPRKDEPEVRKINFFQHDVTKPFPDDFLGTFDLINLRCLSFALTAEGWKVMLKNLYSLLSEQGFYKFVAELFSHDTVKFAEPGGHLLVRDGDILTYNRENPPPSEGLEPDITASLQGTSNVANINRVFAGVALKRGFVVGYAFLFFESRIEISNVT
jgi:hypothetical protein